MVGYFKQAPGYNSGEGHLYTWHFEVIYITEVHLWLKLHKLSSYFNPNLDVFLNQTVSCELRRSTTPVAHSLQPLFWKQWYVSFWESLASEPFSCLSMVCCIYHTYLSISYYFSIHQGWQYLDVHVFFWFTKETKTISSYLCATENIFFIFCKLKSAFDTSIILIFQFLTFKKYMCLTYQRKRTL